MRVFFRLLVASCFVAAASFGHAKDATTTHQQMGYALTFDNDGPALDPKLKDRMVQTFFAVYPKMAHDYNPASTRAVKFSVETGYHGVAATAGGTVHFSADYLRDHPRDIDVITHETMHIVQGYPKGDPGWLIEGIADYARYKYGVDNAGGGWTLPDYQPDQSYTNAYRVTARFLAWVEKHGHPNLVRTLDMALRSGNYRPELWKQTTGKTVDELWHDYGQQPAL